MWRARRQTNKKTFFKLLILGVFIGMVALHSSSVYGDTLLARSLQLTDNQVGATSSYRLSFNIPTSGVLGAIKLQFCANDPLIDNPCDVPSGLDVSAAVLSSQTGETGFTVLPAETNANTITLSRAPTPVVSGIVSYTFDGVINPDSHGTYYGRIQTFASSDATGQEADRGGVAFSIESAVQISATVPPYLLFCAATIISGFDCATASGNYINFGNFSSLATAKAQSQMVTATNATDGFQVSIYGSTMTSGNNVIGALPVADVSRPGVNQFGLNLVANTTPSIGEDPAGAGNAVPLAGYDQPDFFKFVSGDPIASVNDSDEFRKLTVSYIVNVQKDQPIGVYVSTLTYICLANF